MHEGHINIKQLPESTCHHKERNVISLAFSGVMCERNALLSLSLLFSLALSLSLSLALSLSRALMAVAHLRERCSSVD